MSKLRVLQLITPLKMAFGCDSLTDGNRSFSDRFSTHLICHQSISTAWMLMEYGIFAGKWATTKGLLSENHESEPQKESRGRGWGCPGEVKQSGLVGESGAGR